MPGTGIASTLIEILILTKFGSHYLLMFGLMGLGSVISLLLLIFAFSDERFEPNWELIFKE